MTLLGTLAFLAMALSIELVAPLYRVSWKSRWLGIQLTLAKAVGVVLIVSALTSAWTALNIRPIQIHSQVIGAILTIFAVDFLGYWNHRFMHRYFWPVHATHHAIRELSALNGYSHFAEKFSEFFLIAIPLSLIRWDSLFIPFSISIVSQLLAYWIHSPTTAQMHVLRWVIVTPRYHRIHHSLEPKHFDKNFGILFSFWDRLFGTAFIPTDDEWPDTGLEGHDEARSLWQYIVHPLVFRRPASPTK